MKLPTFLKSTALGLASLMVLSAPAMAQDTYVWDEYGIGFTVAGDMIVDDSDPDAFNAVSSDGLISISLSPWADEDVDEETLGQATLEMAMEMYVFDDSDVDGDYVEIDTYNGFYLVVAPSDYDAPDFMLIALLLDTESDTNLVAAIGFEDGNEDEAIAILNSLFSY